MDERRYQEMEMLSALLRKVRSINESNNCTRRIEECIAMAAALTEEDFRTPRKSLVTFLRDLLVEQTK